MKGVRPATPFISSSYWYLRALSLNFLTLLTLLLGAVTWDHWFQGLIIFALDENLPSPVKGLIVYIVFHFFFYWWHRAKHHYTILWRLFHQIHHSIKRLEVLSSNYVHPLDAISGLILSSAIAYSLLGVDMESTAWFSFYLASMGYFIHANITVPRWIGYIIQTPQMHRRHHKYGKHDTNYCDIVWFDMLFGTYDNPAIPCKECGFDQEKENKLVEMLIFKDVNPKKK